MKHDPARSFQRLYDIIRHLRGPDGCAWDRKQTAMSLRTSLVEESYECVDAIERDDLGNTTEELGDVCLIAIMLAVIEEERARFSVSDVLEGVSDKLVRRHPHVFGDSTTQSVDQIVRQWDEIKKKEKADNQDPRILDGVPASMAPLERAYEIQKTVSKVGFDWKEPGPVFEKIEEETSELREAMRAEDNAASEAELGDILFSVINLARLLGVDPARALAATNRKFITRFNGVEDRVKESGMDWEDLNLAQLDQYWDQVKNQD